MTKVLASLQKYSFIPLFALLIFAPRPAAVYGQDSDFARYGGRLVLAMPNDPKSFNDITGKEVTTSIVTGYIFEGLTRTNAETLAVEPALAERWEVSPDGRIWTFFLRPNVQWNDGTVFSAADVVFTFNDLIYNDSIPSSARDIFSIDGRNFQVEKIDDLTVRFTLPVKFAPFLRSLGQAILPKHKLENIVKSGKFNFAWGIDTDPDEIVGTGPYVLKGYRPGERLLFKRNPFYWRRAMGGGRLPYIEEVVYVIVQNQDTAILKFLEGEIDYCEVRGRDYPLIKPLEKARNFTVYKAGADFGSQFLLFNQNVGKNPQTNKPFVDPIKSRWFTDVNFRRAAARAIDRQKINEILYNGLGYLQDSSMSPAGGFFYNPNVVKYDYDLAAAKALLAQSGYIDRDGDGKLEDMDGNKIEFNLYTNADNPQRMQIAAIIRHDLDALGMRVNLVGLEFNTLVSKLSGTYDWDAVILGLTGGIEPHFGKNVWDSAGQLHMWYPLQKTPATDWERRIDAIFSLGVQELDDQKRKILYDEWQLIVSQELPLIYTVLDANMFAVRNKFGNLRPTSYGGAFHNLEEIYIFPESR